MEGRWWSDLLGRRKSAHKPERHVASAAPASGAALAVPRTYSPKNVGNDASARPWESVAEVPAAADASTLEFDADAFLSTSKNNFVSLQAAWDRADIPRLRSMMTDAMLAEIQVQLAERDRHAAEPNRTEVVLLEAHLLGIEDLGAAYMASVEFSGMIREEPSAGPSPFREVWNMTKPRDGSTGWLVAGVQALQ